MKNSKAILQVPGTMKIISAEIPVPKEDEVLIKVEYVGICGSDVHGFGNDSNLLIVFYVQIMPDDFVMQLHR
ncbi:alcohol dehydrogenase catalytic domain-containing protein, partial [Escherichia coli]